MVNRSSANPKTRPGRADGPSGTPRKTYFPPRVTSFGKVKQLVTGGTANANEISPGQSEKRP